MPAALGPAREIAKPCSVHGEDARGAVHKKRPCCVCRRWFRPDVRIGDRQRACGTSECQRARHRAADRAWHARNRDYDRGRRWQVAVDAARAGSPPSVPDRPPPMAGVPWDVAQDAMRAEAVVILAGVVRVLADWAQDEIRKQVLDPAWKSGGVGGVAAGRRDCGRAPPGAA